MRVVNHLAIAPHLLEAMIAHCQEEQPFEACGLLTGTSGQVHHGYAATNLCRHRGAFRVDPEHHALVLSEFLRRGEGLVGIYHSHPTGHPYPSPTDIRQAIHYPEALRLIISLRGPAEVRAFRIEEGRATEIPIARKGELGEWHDLRGGGV